MFLGDCGHPKCRLLLPLTVPMAQSHGLAQRIGQWIPHWDGLKSAPLDDRWDKGCACVCVCSHYPPSSAQGPRIKPKHYILPYSDDTMYSEENKAGYRLVGEAEGEGVLF